MLDMDPHLVLQASCGSELQQVKARSILYDFRNSPKPFHAMDWMWKLADELTL